MYRLIQSVTKLFFSIVFCPSCRCSFTGTQLPLNCLYFITLLLKSYPMRNLLTYSQIMLVKSLLWSSPHEIWCWKIFPYPSYVSKRPMDSSHVELHSPTLFRYLGGQLLQWHAIVATWIPSVPSSLVVFLSLISLLIVYSHAGGNFLCLNLHLDNTDNWLVHVPCLTKHL